MNHYLRNLIIYFENVLHPASGRSDHHLEKRKRKTDKSNSQLISPECFNMRAGALKKQDKLRRSPAP